MQKLIRVLAWFSLFIVFIASIIFSYANTDPVVLSLGFYTFSAQPLAVWVISAFVLGGAGGIIVGVGFLRGTRVRLEARRLRARIVTLEKELEAHQSKAGHSGN